MNMMSEPLLLGSGKSDSQAVKQWAAEDFAITIGLLRECPYHGQPFKALTHGSASKALATGLIDPLDPNVRIFNGDTQELLDAVERVAHHYGERCQYCVASDQEVFD
jgi:hypothetical protein